MTGDPERQLVPAPPGAYSRIRPWRGRDHYLEVVVPAAIQARPEVLRSRHVTPGYLHAVLAAETAHGTVDRGSGRRGRMTRGEVAAAIGGSVRHVANARAVAQELGIYVIVVAGRHMGREERLEAWRRGSRKRGVTNEVAFTIPTPVERQLRARRPRVVVDVCTPPGHGTRKTVLLRFSPLTMGTSTPPPAATAAAPPPHSPNRPDQRRAPGQRQARRGSPQVGTRLARGLVSSVLWLHGCHPHRLAPRLARFERAGWTVRDLQRVMDERNRRLGYSAPARARVRSPWTLLAWYLDDLDVQADCPSRIDERAAAAHQQRQTDQRRADAHQRAAAAPPNAEYLTARDALRRHRRSVTPTRADAARRPERPTDGHTTPPGPIGPGPRHQPRSGDPRGSVSPSDNQAVSTSWPRAIPRDDPAPPE